VERTKTDFDGEARTVLAETEELIQASFHHADARAVEIAFAMSDVVSANFGGNERFDGAPKEFVATEAEEGGGESVKVDDFAAGANDEHGVGSGFQDLVERQAMEILERSRVACRRGLRNSNLRIDGQVRA
jgi:hypothetical protein